MPLLESMLLSAFANPSQNLTFQRSTRVAEKEGTYIYIHINIYKIYIYIYRARVNNYGAQLENCWRGPNTTKVKTYVCLYFV